MDHVVVLVEIKNSDSVRAGREIVILIHICAEVSTELSAVIPDLNLADGN